MNLNNELVQQVNNHVGSIILGTSTKAGRGLYATRTINPGEILLEEEAIVWVPTIIRSEFTSATENGAKEFLSSLQWNNTKQTNIHVSTLFQLCPESRRNHEDDTPGLATKEVIKTLLRILNKNLSIEIPSCLIDAFIIRKIFDENSFVLSGHLDQKTKKEKTFSVIGLVVSMLNHSCAPNVAHYWMWTKNGIPKVRIVAIKSITIGEELMTRYIDIETRPRHTRKAILREKYNFQCECIRCHNVLRNIDGSSHSSNNGDDAIRFRCPNSSCGKGWFFGGIYGSKNQKQACHICNIDFSSFLLDMDIYMDDRSDILSAYISNPTPEKFSKIEKLLHPTDASFFKIYFNKLLQDVISLEQEEEKKLVSIPEKNENDDNCDENETNENILQRVTIVHSQLLYLVECSNPTNMPFLQPSTREAVLKLYLRCSILAKTQSLDVEKEWKDIRNLINTLLYGQEKISTESIFAQDPKKEIIKTEIILD